MADVRRGRQRQPREIGAERVGQHAVHLMTDQPEGDLGDAGRPFVQFDAVELGDIDLAEGSDIRDALHAAAAAGVHPAKDLSLDAAKLAVSDDQEVAAAACRVQQLQRGDVAVGLRLGRVNRAAARLVLGDRHAGPVQVDEPGHAGRLADALLVPTNGPPLHAEVRKNSFQNVWASARSPEAST